jgi:hypothetical protein
MTAKIIQFPAPFQAPEHWSGDDEYKFDHFRREGMSAAEAAQKVEQGIEDLKPRYPGEDVLLRMARDALATAPKRKPR